MPTQYVITGVTILKDELDRSYDKDYGTWKAKGRYARFKFKYYGKYYVDGVYVCDFVQYTNE